MSEKHKCTSCNIDKSPSEFYSRKDRPYGKKLRSICKECADKRDGEYRRLNKIKTRATSMARTALRKGYIARESTCVKCKLSPAVDMHHDNYSRPLDVTWLCRSCHRRTHVSLNEA